MFFGLRFVSSQPIYELQSAVKCFFQHCKTATEFDVDCFPPLFRAVVNRSPVLRRQFETIATLIGQQPEDVRTHVFEVFENNNQIKKLCEDTSFPLMILDASLGNLQDKITKLFDYLYDTTIGTDIFRNSFSGATMQKHFREFRKLNDSVCPFCGFGHYLGDRSSTRSAYDHYLTRTIYPFAAVNFANLIPMCDECNKPINKGTTDILFTSPARTKRRQTFYPYSQHRRVKIDITCKEKPSATNIKGEWGIDIIPTSIKDEEKVNTWKAVFNITGRLEDRLRDQNVSWLSYLVVSRLKKTKCNVTTLRKTLRKEAKTLSNPRWWQKLDDSVLQSYFFSYLANNAETATIKSYCDIAKTDWAAEKTKFRTPLI